MIVRPVTAIRRGAWSRYTPALFVILWSTGFIGSKLGTPYAEPFTFLLLRFTFVIVLMLPIAVLVKAAWPRSMRETTHIAVAGAMIQGGYLGGCFAAIYHGMPAGVVALVVGVQPVLTAVAAAPVLGERVSTLQWLGLVLGLGGVVLVVWQKLSLQGLDATSVAWSVLALVSITAGTIYQKRYCPAFDLRTGSVIQFAAGFLVLMPLALAFETMHVTWSTEFIVALAWLVLVLSIGAVSLLFTLIKHGEATRVSGLFYLTPPTTALMAYFIFGEKLSAMALVGMVIGVVGVALVVRKTGLATPEP